MRKTDDLLGGPSFQNDEYDFDAAAQDLSSAKTKVDPGAEKLDASPDVRASSRPANVQKSRRYTNQSYQLNDSSEEEDDFEGDDKDMYADDDFDDLDDDGEGGYGDDDYGFGDADLGSYERPRESSDSESDSGLSSISNEETYFENMLIYQRKALFSVLIQLQSRAMGTNILSFVAPVVGLLLLWLMNTITRSFFALFEERDIFSPIPFIFGLNYKPLTNAANSLLKVDNCDTFFFTHFAEDASEETKQYWGSNTGEFKKPEEPYGMIGELGNVLNTPCNTAGRMVPYFKEWESVNREDYGSKYASLNDFLYHELDKLAATKVDYRDRNFDWNEDVRALPDAVFTVHEANEKNLRFSTAVNDVHVWQYHRENGFSKVGIDDKKHITTEIIRAMEGQVHAASVINKAYIHNNFPDTKVVSGINFYPYKPEVLSVLRKSSNMLASFLVPLSLSLGLPIFLGKIVLEKEKRLVDVMKINGLKMYNYWMVNYLFDYLYFNAIQLVFYMVGKHILLFDFFVETSWLLIFVVLNGWTLAQISWAFFLSVFVNKAQTASLLGFAVSFYLMFTATTLLGAAYLLPGTSIPLYMHLLPNFTFSRAIQYITSACKYTRCYRDISQVHQFEFQACLVILYVQAIVYMALAMYLYQVVPQTYGVPKKWNWLCKKKRQMGKPGASYPSYDIDEIADLEEDREMNNQPVYDYDTSLEDADARAERNIVYNLDKCDYYKYPLIIKAMRKVYPGFGGRPEKVATKNFSLRIKKGEMFGLLGPNGAGKTTLLSMLTGLYPPTKGNAWVAGFDIRHQLEAVQLQIGVCPQFDVLWDQLTVREHLLFYARIKGIPPHREDEMVSKAMSDVLLSKFQNFLTKDLSGGMKRRLSVAISLVADPKIIYLDEPSTGLDPENRRQLWDILSKLRGQQAMVLTTHSMEEADVLCSRIAIVNNGIMRCVAPQVRLKSLYGGGYHLYINCYKSNYLKQQRAIAKRKLRKKREEEAKSKSADIRAHPSMIQKQSDDDLSTGQKGDEIEKVNLDEVHKKVKDFVKKLLPKSDLIREFNGNFVYLIPNEGFSAHTFYMQFEQNKERLKVQDWGLSQSSLEDVFTKICEQNGGNNA